MKNKKNLTRLLVCVIITTLLLGSVGVHAALPVTDYTGPAPNSYNYDYTTYSISKTDGNRFLYQYALAVGDSISATCASGTDIGNGTTVVYGLDESTVSTGLTVVETTIINKKITANKVGTYSVRFSDTVGEPVVGTSKFSYLYIVVVPDSGDYTLTLPNVKTVNQSSGLGKQLLLQPLSVGEKVTVMMHTPVGNYPIVDDEKAYAYFNTATGDSSCGSSNTDILDFVVNGSKLEIEDEYCEVGTITAAGKGYSLARMDYNVENKNYVTFLFEVPVGYNLPRVKTSFFTSGIANSLSANNPIGLNNKASFNGIITDSANNFSYVSNAKDLGQEAHIAVYQYDEPLIVQDITAFFVKSTSGSTYDAPDAIRIDIANVNYDLPNAGSYHKYAASVTDATVADPAGVVTEYTNFVLPYDTNARVEGTILNNNMFMYLKVGNEYRKVHNYDSNRRILRVEGYFTVNPQEGDAYAIVTRTTNGEDDFTVGSYTAGGTEISLSSVQSTNDYYKGYYITVNGETRKIVSYTGNGRKAYVDSPFTVAITNNTTKFSISVEDPAKIMKTPTDAVKLHCIKTNKSISAGAGRYLTIGSERRLMVDGDTSTAYTEKFTTYPATGTVVAAKSTGYNGNVALDTNNECIMREDFYRILKDGYSELVWKSIYEAGFEQDSSVTPIPDDKKWVTSYAPFNKIIITKDDIENYIKNILEEDIGSYLNPANLIKVTMVRFKDIESNRINDSTKQLFLGDVYVNARPVPVEHSITHEVADGVLERIIVSNLGGTYKNTILAVAQYDKDGEFMTAVETRNVDIEALSILEVNTDIELVDGCLYKIFLWDGTSKIKPLFVNDVDVYVPEVPTPPEELGI